MRPTKKPLKRADLGDNVRPFLRRDCIEERSAFRPVWRPPLHFDCQLSLPCAPTVAGIPPTTRPTGSDSSSTSIVCELGHVCRERCRREDTQLAVHCGDG